MNDMVPHLNGETYFFRDHGQFDLLRLHILPELIEQCRSKKHLRLWSAGCASGEEAYSLAMLVDMLLPERSGWDILIFGSDINQTALTKARRGHYQQWSFRMAPPALRQRYFQIEGNEWILDERIRRMVTFRSLDLIKNTFPSDELHDMDLILCRNVFIYFDAGTVTSVANKQAATLGEGGYLMTGHTELIGLPVLNLRSRLFSEGVVYQRSTPTLIAATPPPVCITPASPTPVHKFHTPSSPALCIEDMLEAAQKSADQGEYDQADKTCRQVLAAAPLAAKPHFLLAQLAQLRGDFGQAEALLNKTLYLDSQCVAAYLELAALYERNEKLSQAKTLRNAALGIIRKLPDDALIEPYETTAAEILPWLTQWEEAASDIPEHRGISQTRRAGSPPSSKFRNAA